MCYAKMFGYIAVLISVVILLLSGIQEYWSFFPLVVGYFVRSFRWCELPLFKMTLLVFKHFVHDVGHEIYVVILSKSNMILDLNILFLNNEFHQLDMSLYFFNKILVLWHIRISINNLFYIIVLSIKNSIIVLFGVFFFFWGVWFGIFAVVILFFKYKTPMNRNLCKRFLLLRCVCFCRWLSWCGGSSDRSFMEWTHWAISHSSQCSTTGVTKAVACVILSVGWCI